MFYRPIEAYRSTKRAAEDFLVSDRIIKHKAFIIAKDKAQVFSYCTSITLT